MRQCVNHLRDSANSNAGATPSAAFRLPR